MSSRQKRLSSTESAVRSNAVSSSRSRNQAKSPAHSKELAERKPSSRLNARTVNPFEDRKPKSAFETAYVNGAVPCRLLHGSVKHKLQWTTQPGNLNYDPVLVTLAEGLHENRHPYTFIACQGFKEMLMIEDAEDRTVPLLPKLIPPMRQALASTDDDVFYRALEALVQLSDVTGPALNAHLKSVLPPISKKVLNRNHKDKVLSALQHLEYNGGKDTIAAIKARIPTYSSIYY